MQRLIGEEPHHEGTHAPVLRINNKYYTAEVPLYKSHPSSITSCKGDALVLVFSAADRNSFEAAQSWFEGIDTSAVEILLAVACKVDLIYQSGQVNRSKWLLTAMDWCSQNCIEYIETSALCPDLDQILELDGDSLGVRRLRQALEAHMWPGLVRKSVPSLEKDRSGYELVTDDCSNDLVDVEDDNILDGHSFASDASFGDYVGVAVDHSISDVDPIYGRSREDEADEFETLLIELQGARERFSGLTDVDRRAAAASLALRLAGMMGEGSDADGDDDGKDIDETSDVHP